jgi:hypothetical protein
MKVACFRLALLGASLVVAGCGPGVPPVGNYATITGTVRDAASGQPIAGAVVSVSVISSSATGSSGLYRLYPIPTGPYTSISASAPNYQPYSNNAGGTLAPGQTLSFDISMTHN